MPSVGCNQPEPVQPADELVREVARQNSQPGHAQAAAGDLSPLIEALRTRFGDAVDAIILYGSCLHTQGVTEEADKIVDLYVVVNDYRQAYRKRRLRYLNVLLPPNVFYLEADGGGARLRAKFAVISMQHLERGIQSWFHSYLWARFAQPTKMVYARDGTVRARINRNFAHAVTVFLKSTVPALNEGPVDVEDIWARGLALTYGAELRPEPPDRARQLARLNLADYRRLTAFAAPLLGDEFAALSDDLYQCRFSRKRQRHARWLWRLRRWQGRVLSILRLCKGALTFDGGIDYGAWKIKRHTGVSVEVTPRMRRHPVIWGLKVLWRLLRQGVLR